MTTSEPQRHGLLGSISDILVPVHRDGHKFIAVALVLTLLGFLLWSPLGWLLAVATLFVAFFFRDPDRVTPLTEGLVVAPADGRITSIERVKPPLELGFADDAERVRISIVLTMLDVHVNRAPVAGRVVRSAYVPGAFSSPMIDKASEENERRALVIATAWGPEVAVVQIAGVVTRRIVSFAHEGDTVGIGQRFGLIRFGSRVDVYLPTTGGVQAAVGQRMVAGETVLADLKSTTPDREARRS